MAEVYDFLDATGVIIPDTSNIQTDVQNEYLTTFGSDLSLVPSTVQGVLITTDTLTRSQMVRNNAAVANQINPNIAGGVFLDAIMALTGQTRIGATPTVVTAQVTGSIFLTIPIGSQASTAAGDVFQNLAPIILDADGNGEGVWTSVNDGPVPCPAGGSGLTRIETPVLGWETIGNSQAGTLGTLQQSDEAARASRLNMLAFQGISLPAAMTSALHGVDGVQSLSFRENYHSSPMGMLISVTNGTTLSGTIWGMTTTTGTGTDGAVIVGTDAINFADSLQDLPVPNPWPIAKYTTTGNITLSGLATQGGGDWPSTLTAGNIILVKDQSSPQQNGVYLAASGAWTRQAYNTGGSQILGSNDGISMLPNSVYVCVNGGEDLDVATAMLENKSSGSDWNGNVSEPVVEPASGQTYTVKFDRPETVGILIKVTIAANTAPSNATADVTQALLDYVNGNVQGQPGFVVGATVSSFELASAINYEFPGIFVRKVEISLVDPISYSTSEILIGLNQIATTDAGSITVITT